MIYYNLMITTIITGGIFGRVGDKRKRKRQRGIEKDRYTDTHTQRDRTNWFHIHFIDYLAGSMQKI